MDKLFELEIKDIPDYMQVKLVKIPAEWDTNNNSQIKQALESSIEKGQINFIFDFSNLRFIDSMGNLGLIAIYIKAKRQQGSIKAFGVNKNINEIFELIGTSKLIPIHESYEEALLSFKK